MTIEVVKQTDRAFGLMWASIFFVVTAVALALYGKVLVWALLATGVLLTVAMVAPGLLMPLNRTWRKLTQLVQLVVNSVVLTVVFVIIMCPIGLLMKILGRDALALKICPEVDTYWMKVENKLDVSNLRDQF